MLNLDKFITKVCNSLIHSRSHWRVDEDHRFIMRNKYTEWGIWAFHNTKDIHVWKQGDWDFNRQLDEAILAYDPNSRNESNSPELPDCFKERIWRAYQFHRQLSVRKVNANALAGKTQAEV